MPHKGGGGGMICVGWEEYIWEDVSQKQYYCPECLFCASLNLFFFRTYHVTIKKATIHICISDIDMMHA